jgi:hypothetical protein
MYLVEDGVLSHEGEVSVQAGEVCLDVVHKCREAFLQVSDAALNPHITLENCSKSVAARFSWRHECVCVCVCKGEKKKENIPQRSDSCWDKCTCVRAKCAASVCAAAMQTARMSLHAVSSSHTLGHTHTRAAVARTTSALKHSTSKL